MGLHSTGLGWIENIGQSLINILTHDPDMGEMQGRYAGHVANPHYKPTYDHSIQGRYMIIPVYKHYLDLQTGYRV